MNRCIFSSILFLLFLVTTVTAAGSSTWSSSDSSSGTQTDTQNVVVANCAAVTDLQARIKCRIENKFKGAQTEEYVGSEESCRVLVGTDKSECVRLYEDSKSCYSLNGENKAVCFKQKVSLGRSLQEASRDTKEKYIVLLLYDIQEKVEDAQSEGKITSDDASRLIAAIVEAKQSVMLHESKDQVRVKIQSVKQIYAEVMK